MPRDCAPPKRLKSGGCPPRTRGKSTICFDDAEAQPLDSLAAIIAHYKRWKAQHMDERAHFRHLPLRKAVSWAALARAECTGKFSHQWRIPNAALRDAQIVLVDALPKLRRSRDFETLHDCIDEAVSGIRGLGELYCYDTAMRIGAATGHSPKLVHLHAGTRVGARNLLGDFGRVRVLKRSRFPAPLSSLPADQIEDILCIYKTELLQLANPPQPRTTAHRPNSRRKSQ